MAPDRSPAGIGAPARNQPERRWPNQLFDLYIVDIKENMVRILRAAAGRAGIGGPGAKIDRRKLLRLSPLRHTIEMKLRCDPGVSSPFACSG